MNTLLRRCRAALESEIGMHSDTVEILIRDIGTALQSQAATQARERAVAVEAYQWGYHEARDKLIGMWFPDGSEPEPSDSDISTILCNVNQKEHPRSAQPHKHDLRAVIIDVYRAGYAAACHKLMGSKFIPGYVVPNPSEHYITTVTKEHPQ